MFFFSSPRILDGDKARAFGILSGVSSQMRDINKAEEMLVFLIRPTTTTERNYSESEW